MKKDNKSVELMKRYLNSASRTLPLKNRADISKEIESMILDICEERYNTIDIDEKQMETVLLELGNPSKLAAKYKEDKPLIGNELMPVFKLVLLIVCLVTTIISLISFSFNAAGMNAADMGLYFTELFSSLMSLIGTIFIIFVILERLIKNKIEIDFEDDQWKVKDLPQLSDKLPGKADIIAGFIFSVLAIIALNLFIDKIGIYYKSNDEWIFIPILAEQIKILLPVFSLRIALGAVVILPLISRAQGGVNSKQNYYYQISQMGLSIFDIGILILLLSNGIDAFFITEAFSVHGLAEFASIAPKLYSGIITVLLGLSIFSMVKRTLVILPESRI